MTEVLETRIDASSKEFCERRSAMEALVSNLREELATARRGGSGRERHVGTLPQTRTRRRNHVIRHVLERRIAFEARGEVLNGRSAWAPVDA